MAQECGFFNAQLINGDEYDRVYLAEQFAAYFASFIGNGVYGSSMQKLEVVCQDAPNMSVKVLSGEAWINGWWYRNTDAYTLNLQVADGVLPRIDAVVLRWGNEERDMWLEVITGVPSGSPQVPALRRDADYYDLRLAYINIPAGAIRVTQAQINDTRLDNAVCGLVTGVVDQIDTTDLYNQFTAYFNEFKTVHEADFDEWTENQKQEYLTYVAHQKGLYDKYIADTKSDYDTWTAEQKSQWTNWVNTNEAQFTQWMSDQMDAFNEWYNTNTETWTEQFETWFEHIQTEFEGNIAGNLQIQIDNLSNSLDETNDNVAENTDGIADLLNKVGMLKNLQTADKQNVVAALNWLLNELMEPSIHITNPAIFGDIVPYSHEQYYAGHIWDISGYYRVPFPDTLYSASTAGEVVNVIPVTISKELLPDGFISDTVVSGDFTVLHVQAEVIGFNNLAESQRIYGRVTAHTYINLKFKDGTYYEEPSRVRVTNDIGYNNSSTFSRTASGDIKVYIEESGIWGVEVDDIEAIVVFVRVYFGISPKYTNDDVDNNYLEIQITDPAITGTDADYTVKVADQSVYNRDYLIVNPEGNVYADAAKSGNSPFSVDFSDGGIKANAQSGAAVPLSDDDMKKIHYFNFGGRRIDNIYGKYSDLNNSIYKRLASNRPMDTNLYMFGTTNQYDLQASTPDNVGTQKQNNYFMFGKLNRINENSAADMDRIFALFGIGLIGKANSYTNRNCQIIVGKYNEPTSGGTDNLFTVGTGTSDTNRVNGFTVKNTGVVSSSNTIIAGGGLKSNYYDTLPVYNGNNSLPYLRWQNFVRSKSAWGMDLNQCLMAYGYGLVRAGEYINLSLLQGSQFLIVTHEFNSTTGAYRGSRCRMITTLPYILSSGRPAESSTLNGLNLCASTNAGVTFAVYTNPISSGDTVRSASMLQVKASTSYDVQYRIFIIGTIDTNQYEV